MSDCTLPEPLNAIMSELEALRARPDYQAWCRFQRSFHVYSLPNRLLIRDQRPDATLIASRRRWTGLGRQVLTGQRPLRVYAPPRTPGHRFRSVAVWDVAQTSGRPLPQDPLRPVTATNAARLWGRIEAAAADLSVTVELVPPSLTGARGWYSLTTRTISVVSTFAPAEQVRTLPHELAHAATPTLVRARLSYAEQEVVAELVAAITARRLAGLDLGDASVAYLDSWLAGQALPSRLLLTALATESQLIV